jgi:SAM-dependent methyltransferase
MVPVRIQSPATRRNHIRTQFDSRVKDEWNRFAVESRRILARNLRERFLRLHLRGTHGVVLELGPGPGRFTPTISRAAKGRVVSLDLSREALRAGRSHARREPSLSRIDWLQGAGEYLPLRPGSLDAAVTFGNVVCFASLNGPALMREIARAMRPGGRLIVDFAPPAAALEGFLYESARKRILPRILRRPDYYLIDTALETGFNPYIPARLANWEFKFYTAPEARKLLQSTGFRPIDAMCVAPMSFYHEEIASVARREKRTWEALLRIEEKVGRRPGVLETGQGFVVAAIRK